MLLELTEKWKLTTQNNAYNMEANQISKGFSFKALSCTSFGFWDPLAEKEIIKLCRCKSTRLGISESKVIASEFRILSCALMRGLSTMILNRDKFCDDIDNDTSLNLHD